MDRIVRLKPYQDRFIFTESRYPGMVAAWATGKSMCGIHRGMIHSEKYEDNLGVIFRKEYTDLRDSTIKDFERYTQLKVDSSRETKLSNNSTIMFRHMEELNNLQNINLGWFLIEQAEEIDSEDPFMLLLGRLRRDRVPHWGGVMANTKGHNWIYRLWKLGGLKGSELIEAKTKDNADVLPPDYIESLEQLKITKPKMWARFVDNSWEDTDAVDLVIDPEWVRNAIGRTLRMDHPIKRIVTVDVSTYGDDKTVFYAIESARDEFFKTLGKETHEKKNTMEIVGRAVLFGKRHGISSFAVDETSFSAGCGVGDRLRELGYQCIPVNSSRGSINPDKYFNTRAEVYGTGADKLMEGKVSILMDDVELQEQLSWAKYKKIESNGKLQIEAKPDIKVRYGRSPDNADAFLNGLWALKKVRAEKNPATSHEEILGWQGGNFTPEWAKEQEPAVRLR